MIPLLHHNPEYVQADPDNNYNWIMQQNIAEGNHLKENTVHF